MAKRTITITIDDERINPETAAKVLGMSAQGLRKAMRNDKFDYFGAAWKSDDICEKWTYYINANRFLEYVGVAAARGIDLPEIQEYLQKKLKEQKTA